MWQAQKRERSACLSRRYICCVGSQQCKNLPGPKTIRSCMTEAVQRIACVWSLLVTLRYLNEVLDLKKRYNLLVGAFDKVNYMDKTGFGCGKVSQLPIWPKSFPVLACACPILVLAPALCDVSLVPPPHSNSSRSMKGFWSFVILSRVTDMPCPTSGKPERSNRSPVLPMSHCTALLQAWFWHSAGQQLMMSTLPSLFWGLNCKSKSAMYQTKGWHRYEGFPTRSTCSEKGKILSCYWEQNHPHCSGGSTASWSLACIRSKSDLSLPQLAIVLERARLCLVTWSKCTLISQLNDCTEVQQPTAVAQELACHLVATKYVYSLQTMLPDYSYSIYCIQYNFQCTLQCSPHCIWHTPDATFWPYTLCVHFKTQHIIHYTMYSSTLQEPAQTEAYTTVHIQCLGSAQHVLPYRSKWIL